MIRFYVLAIDSDNAAQLSWKPAIGAALQTLDEAGFRAIDPDALADECLLILDRYQADGKRRPTAASAPAGGELFPDAGPLKPYAAEEDPDAWRREVE